MLPRETTAMFLLLAVSLIFGFLMTATAATTAAGAVITMPGPVITMPGPVITMPGPVITMPGPVITMPAAIATTQQPVRFEGLVKTVVTLKESESANTELATFQCKDLNIPAQNTKVTVQKKNMPPGSPCADCFDVIPCNNNNVDWCLQYDPSRGTLDIAIIDLYEMTLICDNEDGQKITENIHVRVIRDTTPPTFDLPVTSLVLLESQKQAKDLQKLECTDSDAGQTVDVKLTSVEPAAGACKRCFSLLPCKQNWCLKYVPSGHLDSTKVNNYKLTFKCTDSLGLSVTKEMDIHINKNTPPVFDHAITERTQSIDNTFKIKAADEIFKMKIKDPDIDDVIEYRLETEKNKDDFEIDLGTGIIRAKKDLSSSCYASTTLKVYANDGVNKEIGPHVINLDLKDANSAPSIKNLDFKMQVEENSPLRFVYSVKADDVTKPDTIKYMMTATPREGLNYFKISPDSGQITLKKGLDYEDKLMARKFKLDIQATDGACVSETKTLTIDVTDVNEEPVIFPDTVEYTVDEGSIDLDPSKWDVRDPDFRDEHTYTIVNGNKDGRFTIDAKTGRITTTTDYDIDKGRMPDKVKLKVKVTDKGGLSDEIFVNIKILDINDNPPVIDASIKRSFVVSNCSLPGELLSNIRDKVTDRDSRFRDNNIFGFVSTNNGPLTVQPNGDIILTAKMNPGDTASTVVRARDHGQKPGPLSSNPVTISVRAVKCRWVRATRPPPPIRVTRPPAALVTKPPKPPIKITKEPVVPTQPPTITKETTTKVVIRDTWMDENLPWIIISALLGTILLALATYMCLRYVVPKCGRIKLCKKRPRRTKLKPLTEKKQHPAPRPEPEKTKPPVDTRVPIVIRTPSPPPSVVVGPQDGKLLDFWKEHYNEQNFDTAPARNSIPKPTKEAFQPFSKDLDLDVAKPDVPVGNDVVAPKQGKTCVIQ